MFPKLLFSLIISFHPFRQGGGGSFLGKDESCFDELTLRSTNTTPTISGLTMLKEAHLTMLFLKLGLSLS